MLLFSSVSIQPLNYSGFAVLRFSLGLAVKFALFNSSSLSIANCHDSRAKLGPEARQYGCTEKPELGGRECLRQTTVGVG